MNAAHPHMPPTTLLVMLVKNTPQRSERIAALNDQARQSLCGCRLLISRRISDLGDVAVHAVLREVQRFSDFTPRTDPYAEHDFGSFAYAGTIIFWQFNYLDLDLHMPSPDATDPTVTARVLTIMLADEY